MTTALSFFNVQTPLGLKKITPSYLLGLRSKISQQIVYG